MIAANIWHWWIGLILTVVALVAVVGIIGGYIKNVTMQRYPGKRQRED
jgi:hypothetical protein